MKKKTEPLGIVQAIAVFLVGLIVGSIFIFGMQHWNANVDRNDCITINSSMTGYEISRRKGRTQLIYINCLGDQKYSIDGVTISDKLIDELSEIEPNNNIRLLIHPNSDTIVEFSVNNKILLDFDETIELLGKEATGFIFIGAFMYLASLIGLYYIIYHIINKQKSKKIKK